jgi:DNA-binding MarR family transcriptional regulator
VGGKHRSGSDILATDRDLAITTYLELVPVVRARLSASVPEELHREIQSMTAHQLRALLLLPSQGTSMGQLATQLGVTSATVSVLADRLVSQGLAVRSRDPSDRRVVRLAPSPKGSTLAARAADQRRRSVGQMFAQLSDGQVIALIDVLRTLAEWKDEPDWSPAPGGSPRHLAKAGANS